MVGVVARHADGIASFNAAIAGVDTAIDDLWNRQQNVFIGDELVEVADNLDSGGLAVAIAAPDERALLQGIANTSRDLRDYSAITKAARYATIFQDGPLTRGGEENARNAIFTFLKNAVDNAQSQARQGIDLLERAGS